MSIVQIKCPHCGTQSDLHLESDAMMIVLTCNSCKSPLMYYYGKTFEVDNIEMGDLSNEHMQAVEGFMKIRSPIRFTKNTQTQNDLQLKDRPHHHKGEAVRSQEFSSDDIADLMIDLAKCKDVDDFLKSI